MQSNDRFGIVWTGINRPRNIFLCALTFAKELLSFSRQTEFVVVAVLCCVVVVVVFFFASASLVLYMQFLHSLHKTLQE